MGEDSPIARYRASPVELKLQFEAMRGGSPYLILRDGSDAQRIFDLGEVEVRLTVGRHSSCDVGLEWDDEVSRVHAELQRVGEQWLVTDDGLSSNGTFVNGIRLTGRRRLRDGDILRFGATVAVYRDPGDADLTNTSPGSSTTPVELSAAQRRVLVSLCRPYRHSGAFTTPAKNKEIADELTLSVETVKSALRVLFDKFGVQDLPQNEKRTRLVALAFERGAITAADLVE